ncbi:glycoside hydrolase family 9 protein [Dactylosporangium sp. NPDC051541]|uniref:glycoside hydrolase family 9 protein n=1 Tax=Dactylosporangium sp. NPDC051541 TaxID=3363977 RepID=UPI0037A68D07
MRPLIRVNQVGYLTAGPKCATWVHDSAAAEPFAVVQDASVVLRGASQPRGVDAASALAVHLLDFGALPDGTGYHLVAGDDHSHPFRVGSGLYGPLYRDALRVFYLLRSGCPIDDARAPGYGRPAGHTADTAVPGVGERVYPGWRPTGTFDVSGGWYDAGDYGKYTVSGGIALWQLLEAQRLRPDPLLEQECRFQLAWMLRMRVPDGQPYAGMAFHRVHGHTWSPMPGWPHEDPTERVLHRPSTAATLHLAAVVAKAALVLHEPAYLPMAHAAYRAAAAHPDLIAPDDEGRYGGGPYGDPDVTDDFAFAAAALGLETPTGDFPLDGFDFDAVSGPTQLDLALAGRIPPDGVRQAGDRLLELQARQPWGQPYAPAGGWSWGSNGRILNNLVVLAVAHQLTGARRFRDGVARGMDYLLGRNGLGQSYIVGYGPDASRHLRTRQFGHDLDPAMPPPPPGALAGGANSVPTPGFPSDPRLAGRPPQLCYLDEPTSETTNDLCVRWNAPLVYVTAFLDRHPG